MRKINFHEKFINDKISERVSHSHTPKLEPENFLLDFAGKDQVSKTGIGIYCLDI